jgi:agmatine/peptidylarginine deiminase
MRTLGCPTLAILPELPDETTGHVDVIAQFLSPTVAVVASVDPRADIQMAIALDEATERLAEAAELRGERLSIVRLPMEVDGEAFYSYVNSTRLKNRLLVPDYDRVSPQTQRLAYAKLKSALPTVELVPIKADMMADRGGAVHCVTLGLGPTTTQPTELARPRGRPKPRG